MGIILRWTAQAVLFFLLSVALADESSPAGTLTLPRERVFSCKQYLNFESPRRALDVLTSVLDTVILKQKTGFTVKSASDHAQRPMRRILISKLYADRSRWRKERWSYNGENYLFLNIGLRNLEQDMVELNEIVIDHLYNHKGEDLYVEFGSERIREIQFLLNLRRKFLNAVPEVYRERKPYLTAEDYADLNTATRKSIYSDIFVLLRDIPDSYSWSDIEQLDVQKHTLAISQIAYRSLRVTLAPTRISLLKMVKPEMVAADREERYPFEFRVHKESFERTHDLINVLFDPARTCEFSRRVNFCTNFPNPVKDLFVLELFLTAMNRGMTTSIASVDAFTDRLFRMQYGFTFLMELPTKSGKKNELLSYLDLTSAAYQTMLNKLVRSTADVRTVELYNNSEL